MATLVPPRGSHICVLVKCLDSCWMCWYLVQTFTVGTSSKVLVLNQICTLSFKDTFPFTYKKCYLNMHRNATQHHSNHKQFMFKWLNEKNLYFLMSLVYFPNLKSDLTLWSFYFLHPHTNKYIFTLRIHHWNLYQLTGWTSLFYLSKANKP